MIREWGEWDPEQWEDSLSAACTRDFTEYEAEEECGVWLETDQEI